MHDTIKMSTSARSDGRRETCVRSGANEQRADVCQSHPAATSLHARALDDQSIDRRMMHDATNLDANRCARRMSSVASSDSIDFV